jgi:hypothetical protein
MSASGVTKAFDVGRSEAFQIVCLVPIVAIRDRTIPARIM